MAANQVGNSAKTETLRLFGNLTVERAIELKTILERSLATTDCLAINVEPQSEVDFSFIQLLCSAHRSANKQGKVFIVDRKVSDLLRDVVRRSGYARSATCKSCSDSRCLWTEDVYG